jgi:hypothetical protein
VGVNAPAYVYVALASADGSQAVIFPKADGQPDSAILKPGAEQRIPGDGQWFRLDKTVGHENIFVYAAKKPLTKEDVLSRVVADNKKPRKATPPKGAGPRKPPKQPKPSHGGGGVGNTTGTVVAANDDAPVASNDDTRGLELVDEATVGADQVTRKHFTINHAK